MSEESSAKGLPGDYFTEDELAGGELRVGPPVTCIGRKRYYHKEAARDWMLSRETSMGKRAA